MMRYVALAGGVGGAKMVDGLAKILAPDELTIVVNTGDDFSFMGLDISPDLDTVCYTLAGLANLSTGWGRAGETWNAMANFVRLGGPDWFHLGDNDLGTHLERTRRLKEGCLLSQITTDFCIRWNVRHPVLPMTDDKVETWINTVEKGWLPFQEYFVREQCNPRVISFEFRGAKEAHPAQGVVDAIKRADWVILCPSNPWVSIDPILSIGDICELIQDKPIVAISPIIGGTTIKGPAAKMYNEMGIKPSAEAVSDHYLARLRHGNLADDYSNPRKQHKFIYFLDLVDSGMVTSIKKKGIDVVSTNIIMNSLGDRESLANEIIEVCQQKMAEG